MKNHNNHNNLTYRNATRCMGEDWLWSFKAFVSDFAGAHSWELSGFGVEPQLPILQTVFVCTSIMSTW